MELKQLQIRQPKLCFNPPPRTTTTNLYKQCLYLFPNSNIFLYSPLRNVQAQYRRWDSNAENFRAQNFNFNPKPNRNDDEEDDDEAGEWFEVLEEFIDGAWIFPVFRSFGWMLPAIISSLLITSGPKAFLMALAVPLGQSALSLAFQRIVGKKSSKPKRKARTRRRPRARSARNVKFEEDEEETDEDSRKDSMGYQTWVGGNDVRADRDSQRSPRYGGWDDLDRQSKTYKGSENNSAQNTGSPQRSKLSRGGRKGETPLLLRLLIAVFPFLGSWTRLL